MWSDGQGPPLTGTNQKGLKTTTVCDALNSGVGLWSMWVEPLPWPLPPPL